MGWLPPAVGAPAEPLRGFWSLPEEGVVVEFRDCGGLTCGVIRSIDRAHFREGDVLPKCGMAALHGFPSRQDAQPFKGIAVDMENGKPYAAELVPVKENHMKLVVRAFAGLFALNMPLQRVEPSSVSACEQPQ